MIHAGRVAAGFAISLILACFLVFASDPPDSKTNPQSSYIETTDSHVVGSQYDLRLTITTENGPVVYSFGSAAFDDNGPRLAISSGGDTWVVWWRAASTDQVLIRKLTYATGNWSSERLVSDSDEGSRHPEIVYDGATPWVAYEFDAEGGGTSIAVNGIKEDPIPIGFRTLLRTTSYAGDTDVLAYYESGHLWVTWVDSASNVGWCEYDYGTTGWSSPSFESYANDSVAAARGRVRTAVLN